MRRLWRGALVVGVLIGTFVVAALVALIIMSRVAPGTMLSSCSYSPPAHSCSPPASPWAWVPCAAGALGAGSVAVLLDLRRRGVLGPLAPPPASN